jgi:tetratricopeptide (TPR) repeat protein
MDQYPRVIEDFDKAIELYPDTAFSYTDRGVSYGKLGQYQQAIEDFDKAIQLQPGDAAAYYNRGLVYDHLGH